jgi:hypothetical protein
LLLADTLFLLRARLPELEWQLQNTLSFIDAKKLPRGLFRCSKELTPSRCIQEIRADLDVLEQREEMPSLAYLVARVSQKIHVLVSLCLQPNEQKAQPVNQRLSMSIICTRNQWITQLSRDIEALVAQQQALQMRLAQPLSQEVRLVLCTQLADVEKRLTLAQESLAQRR